MSGGHRRLLIVVASLGLVGCGLTNPDIKEIWDMDFPADPSLNKPPVSGTAQIEYEIRKRIYCELKEAVYEANHYPVTKSATLTGPQTLKTRGLIPLNWAAQITMSLEVDEVSSVNPGVSLNQVMHNAIKAFGPQNTVTTPQSFSLGFGATLSSTATRIDKFNPYYSIEWLSKPWTSDSVCYPQNDPFVRLGLTPASSSPFILESNLGIKDWLLGAMFVTDQLPSHGAPPAGGLPSGSPGPSGGGSTPKPDTVTYEIKFIIVSSGNVTPTWKLVRWSANTGMTPLFGMGRTRTHDLIITIGPATPDTAAAHNVAATGSAVSSGVRAVLTSP